jgi:hypothetical protein
VTIDDIDSGINWKTVPGPAPAPGRGRGSVGSQREDETLFCVFEDGIDNPDKAETVKYWQTKLAALGQDTGSVDGRYHDKTKLAVREIVAGADGMRIDGDVAAQIDVALARLGPDASAG